MKKKKIFILLLFLFISLFSFSASYRISSLDVLGVLKEDGSMEVSETVSYEIDEINGILFDIDAKGFGDITNLQVFEDVETENGNIKFKKVSPSKYEITERDGLYKIKLYSKNRNNSRSFNFVYTLPNAVIVYDDVAQLNRKMVGKNWQQSIWNVLVQIWIPIDENYDNSKILAFGHGPLSGDIEKEKNIVRYSLEDYYPGDFVEANILMEPVLFSKIDKNKIVHKNMKQELLDMEKKLADEANAEREKYEKREEFYNNLKKNEKTIFAIGAGIWAAIMFYIHGIFKRKNEYKNMYGKYLRELPDNYSPSLAGTVITGQPNSEEILATLLDLIRKKVLSLESSGGKNKLLLIENEINLSKQESIILDIYINDFGNRKSVILEDIKKSVPTSVARKFEKWQYQIFREADRKNFSYEGLGFLKGAPLFLLGLAFFFLGGIAISLFENPLFILFFIMSFTLLISTFGVRKPNIELKKAKTRWGAFKNFLEDYSQLEEAKINSIHLWEQYFVYAVAMGVSEKVVKAYKQALKMGYVKDMAESMGTNSLRTLSLMDMYSKGNFSKSINSITKATYHRSMSTISKSRMSSSSGGGGGFSSRSSGGGGSRGGGGAF